MKKFFGLTIVIILIGFSGFSQAGYRPGFIIKNNGDTLNGLIFYCVDGKFEKTCLFKRFEIAREFNYSPVQIKAFGFRNGRYFESKKAEHEKSFYEGILKGETSVFVRSGKSGGMVYIENPITGFFKLSKGKNRLLDGGTYNSYRETLEYLQNKSGNMKADFSSVSYDARKIASAIAKTSNNIQTQTRAFYATNKVRYLSDYSLTNTSLLYKIGINGGYQFLNLKITGTQYSDYFREAVYNSTFRPCVGLFINRKLSKRSKHTSIELGLNYLADSYYGYAEHSDGSATDRNDIMIDFKALQLPLSVKLTFGKQKMHPYLKAGAFKSFLIQDSYNRFSEHEFKNEIFSDNFSDFDLKGDIGFQGGAGMEFDLGTTRSFGIDALYIWGGQLLVSSANLSQKTTMETSGFAVMMHINF